MRKNFFKKKLASTLALAMVVTSLVVPTSASAATATKVVKQGGGAAPAVLYVGDKGTDYGLSKTFKGTKYTWTISNSKIATINKSGVVTAKTPGTVTVKVTARNAKGKWLAAFTQKVKINLRATSVDIGADDFTLVMGQEKDLNAVKTPAKSTDALKYVSDNTAVATVNAKSGVVKTVGVGEATITVLSKAVSTSADTSKYNKKDTVKVTVVDGIQSIKQTTPLKFEVTFATDQSQKLTAGDLTVTDPDGVKQIIKDLSFSADGKTATVQVYIELSDNVTYKVAYGKTDKTFVASKGDVANVTLEGKTVQYAKPTVIDVKLLDKNGVDVTDSNKLDYVTFEYDNSEAYIGKNADGKYEIQVYNFPKSVSVTAIYHTYKYTDGDETTFKSTAVINSVEEIKETAKDITYTVASNKESVDWTKLSNSVPATAQNYKVFIKAKDGSGNDLDETDFSFESSDTNILSVSEDGDIYPVKTGSGYIKATYGATSKMLAVVIGAESKTVNLTPDTSVITFHYVDDGTNPAYFVDTTKTIALTAKDQYGNKVSGGTISNIEALNNDLDRRGTYPIDSAVDDGANKFVVTVGSEAINSYNDGSYNFRLTYEGKQTTVTVKFVKVTNSKVSFVNFDKSSTTLDAVINAQTDSSTDTTLAVYGYNTSGQPVKKYTNPAEVVYTATLDGDKYTGATVATNAAAGVIVTALDYTGVNGSVATQAATGTYEIKATVAGIPSGNTTITKYASSKVIVKNSMTAPTIKVETSKVDSGYSYLTALDDAFTVKLGKETLTIVGAKIVEASRELTPAEFAAGLTKANKSITVKELVVAQVITDKNGNDITVNRTLKTSQVLTVK